MQSHCLVVGDLVALFVGDFDGAAAVCVAAAASATSTTTNVRNLISFPLKTALPVAVPHRGRVRSPRPRHVASPNAVLR